MPVFFVYIITNADTTVNLEYTPTGRQETAPFTVSLGYFCVFLDGSDLRLQSLN
jgi:hypothetical protein